MTKNDALRCDYCGGFINPTTYKCPYCGTQYVKPNGANITANGQKIHFVEKSAPCDVYGVETRVPLETIRLMADCSVPLEEEIRRDFAEKIAREIAQKLVIYEDFSIETCEKRFSARLRVVKPDFRF